MLASADVDRRLSLTIVGIKGAAGLLALPEFADIYRELGLVIWIRCGQETAVTPVTGMSDDLWADNTRPPLAEYS